MKANELSNAKLLYNDPPRVFSPKLAERIGLNNAIFIQQIHWLIVNSKEKKDQYKCKDGLWWVYYTFDELQDLFFPFWSTRTIRRIATHLMKMEVLLVEKYDEKDWDRRNWYSINYEALVEYSDGHKSDDSEHSDNDRIGQNVPIEEDKLSSSNRTDCPPQSGQVVPIINSNTKTPTKTPTNTLTDNSVVDSGNSLSAEESFNDKSRGISYLDTDEEGNPLDEMRGSVKWKKPTSSLCEEAFRATGKKSFTDKRERSMWVGIDKESGPWDGRGVVKYPTEYVRDMIKWAEKENNAYQSATLTSSVKITFSNLIKAIKNEERRSEWVSRRLKREAREGGASARPLTEEDINGDQPTRFNTLDDIYK
jgi:hypothetical protein